MSNPCSLIAALLSISGGGSQADLVQVKSELNANYGAMASAFLHKNIKGISKFLDVNFSTTSLFGNTRSFDVYLEDVERQMGSYTDVSWYRKVSQLVRSGTDFVATVEGHLKATGPGQDGKPHKLDITSTVVDTWKRSGRRWLLKSNVVKRRTVLMDGKPHQGPLVMRVVPPIVRLGPPDGRSAGSQWVVQFTWRSFLRALELPARSMVKPQLYSSISRSIRRSGTSQMIATST